ncbi:peptidyl-prolyl cis-trans isomerase [Mangrovimonas cancribranchiae]|uniref:Peptidyl-prolyl cis-trans isomerase n=1 Tax=Mangrovimonas cancribranchiae TaxID=3080055 RepID=A0AAU6P4X2_9FLAO
MLLVTLSACNFFKKTEESTPVARVNDTYLYKEDIEKLLSDNLSKEDSTVLVNNYINRWATQQLLVEGAKRNLSEQQVQAFEDLTVKYKNDLFSNAYLEALVDKNIDTTVTLSEAQSYYEDNKSVFNLNEDLIKFRYIHIDENAINLEAIKEKFKRFNTSDKKHLDSISIQFKSYSLKDSVWIKLDQVVDKVPVITIENKPQLLKKSNFIQLKDSLGLYLMHVNDVLTRNSTAPLEYVKPTIDQIVINKRKLELIKELEKDITKDATKNKNFEIYN